MSDSGSSTPDANDPAPVDERHPDERRITLREIASMFTGGAHNEGIAIGTARGVIDGAKIALAIVQEDPELPGASMTLHQLDPDTAHAAERLRDERAQGFSVTDRFVTLREEIFKALTNSLENGGAPAETGK